MRLTGREGGGGGKLRRQRSKLGFLLGGPGVCMGQCNALVAIYMAFYIHIFAWVDLYLACGCAASDDTPFSMFRMKGS